MPINECSTKTTESKEVLSRTTSKPKTKRRKKSFSAINQIQQNHPKNSTPPKTTQLTRKQLLRLTEKQRANLKQKRLEEFKASRTYLDQARTNVRSNLKFLKGTAESNLKKNIQTIKRLFNGEEVWKDEATVNESPKHHHLIEKNQKSLEWGNLPTAIQSNFKNNISTIQNWLHRITDGAIPSPNLTTSTSSGGSVATRIQQFHEMKTHQPLVMDNKWIAWNIVLALTPAFMIHLYCLSVQDEMREYHARMEEMERERILGHGVSGGNRESGMGLSSALVTEGGGVWDKVKMAVNDLLLGGADEKVQTMANRDNTDSESSEASSSADLPATTMQKQDQLTTSIDTTNDKDATIEVLLQRIQALEQQVGIVKQPNTHDLNRETAPTDQSPIQKRRDEHMKSLWRKQDEEKQSQQKKEDESSTFEMLSDSVKSLTQLDGNFLTDWINEKCVELAQQLPFTVRVVEEKPNDEVASAMSDGTAESPDESHKILKEESTKTDRVQVRSSSEPTQVNDEGDDAAVIISVDDAAQSKSSRWYRWWSKIAWNRQTSKPTVEEQINSDDREQS